MWRMSFGMVRTIALTFVVALCCNAQTLNIWPGVATGSETWGQKERVEKNTPLGTVVFNVVTPTLTVYVRCTHRRQWFKCFGNILFTQVAGWMISRIDAQPVGLFL